MAVAPRPTNDAASLAAALARCPEAVCRRYLPHGRRQGRYWIAGDLGGARGRSLFVRLRPPGPPGKWTDAATGEHGDLLDLIGHRIGARSLRPALDEARAFLALPAPRDPEAARADPPVSWDSAAAARRLWGACRPLGGTRAEAYLRARGLDACRFPSLRFHPALAYRDDASWRRFPALVAAVTSPGGTLEGVLRTWLHPDRPAKAPVAQPRKALGRVHGHAVRFGAPAGDGATLLVGEGIETVLSLVAAAPALHAAAALSAGSLPPSSRPRAPPASSSPATVTPRAGVPRRGSRPGHSRRASPPPSSCLSTGTSTTISPPSGRGRWPRGSPRSSAPGTDLERPPRGADRCVRTRAAGTGHGLPVDGLDRRP